MSTPKTKEQATTPEEKIGELCAILGDLHQRVGAGVGPQPFRAPGSDVRFAGYQPYPLPDVALRHLAGVAQPGAAWSPVDLLAPAGMAAAAPYVTVM